MGAADVVEDRKPEPLPPYPEERFEENLPAWRDAIAKGSITADQIIARSSSKYVISDEQKAKLKTPAKQAAADDDGVVDAEFVKDYEGATQ